jgi:hypothetical protein
MRVAGVCGVVTEVAVSIHAVLSPRFVPSNPATVSFSLPSFRYEPKSYMLLTARNITLEC